MATLTLTTIAAGHGLSGGETIRLRDPSTDTYEADALFGQCALHMPLNSRGSRTRYVK